MSSEEDRKLDRLYDKRTLDRNQRKGLVSPKAVETRLNALPDLQDKVAPPPPELAFTSVAAAPSGPSIPKYTITISRKDPAASLKDDEDLPDDDDLDDEDDDLDDEDDDLDNEDAADDKVADEVKDDKALPEAG